MPSGTARRYAKAVFELAQEEGRVEEWEQRLQAMRQLFADPELHAVLANPVIAPQRRAEAIDVVDQDGRLGNEGRNLAKLLAEQRRPDLAEPLWEEFEGMADEAAGRVRGTLTTAVELSEKERQPLAGQLSSRLGREIRLTFQVDPSILGGVILQLGDRLVDASLRGRLDQLRRRLAGA